MLTSLLSIFMADIFPNWQSQCIFPVGQDVVFGAGAISIGMRLKATELYETLLLRVDSARHPTRY